MTLTSFIDVKADPQKPDETKVDLLSSSNGFVVNGETSTLEPVRAIEYVELYNHRLERRRRICRAVAWLLALFLLVDIVLVLYMGLRMRQHVVAAASDANGDRASAAAVTCGVRFIRHNGRHGSVSVEERSERITASRSRVLMQPMWASDGMPTVLHSLDRGFTLIRSPSTGLCFVKHMPWRRDGWSVAVAKWAKRSHDVSPEQTHYVRLAVIAPPISLEQLMTYGDEAWHMCRHYRTYRVVLLSGRRPSGSPARQLLECPMVKCVPCDSGVYLRNEKGCQTCECGPAPHEAAEDSSFGRSRRSAASHGQVLELDEGVLPDDQGRSVRTIDVIEF